MEVCGGLDDGEICKKLKVRAYKALLHKKPPPVRVEVSSNFQRLCEEPKVVSS
jgi:hypothetical protein